MTAELPSRPITADAKAAVFRYRDAFLVSDTVIRIGTFVKIAGFFIGGIYVVVPIIAFGQGPSDISNLAIGVGVAMGVLIAVVCFVLGTLVTAIGQIQRATLDTAVHSSPFLDDDLRSRALGLGTRPKITFVIEPDAESLTAPENPA